MPSEREVIEKAAVKAHDIRKEAKAVKLYGAQYNVKPPKIIELKPSSALIQGQISHVVKFGGDPQSHYRIQVDGNGIIAKHETDEIGWHENLQVHGLSLIGTFDDVLSRLNQTPINESKNKNCVKLSVGIAWAYARAAQLKSPDPVSNAQLLSSVITPLKGIHIAKGLSAVEDPDQGGEIAPQPE